MAFSGVLVACMAVYRCRAWLERECLVRTMDALSGP